MKNKTKLPNVYLGVILALMYVPILLVILYSFNESKISSVWAGFSLKWYEELFRDKAMFQALGNTLFLGVVSSLSAGVIGTLGAYGMSKVNFRSKGAVEYLSTLPIMIPEIILGMVFMAFFSLIGIPVGMGALIFSPPAGTAGAGAGAGAAAAAGAGAGAAAGAAGAGAAAAGAGAGVLGATAPPAVSSTVTS